MADRTYAIDLYNRALPIIQTDPPTAYRLLVAACENDPSFAEGWAFLGAALADIGNLPACVSALRQALRCPDGDGPGDMNPVLRHRCLVNLGHRLIDNRIISEDTIIESICATREAIMMSTNKPEAPAAFAHTNLSLIYSLEGRSEGELHHAHKGFELCPDPATELGLAFAQLFNGQYREGLEHFEARFRHSPKLVSYQHMPWPRWDGSRVGTLIVLAEMGLGDSLSFARFIDEASTKVDRLIFVVQPELVKLLSEECPTAEVVPQDHTLPPVDAWCPVFSLPVPLDLGDDQITHREWTIAPKAVEDTSWKRKGARLHVAIAWAGAPANDIDRHRSIPFAEFLALREIPGIALYSVQVGERARDLHDNGAAALVRDMSPWIRDARDTAGIMAEMDIVICCESFVGHLAGAIGKKCLLLCSRFGRDWRSSPYLGDRSLWYPEHRVFRQGDDACWQPVFKRVVEALS